MSKVTRVTTTLKTVQKLSATYQRTKDEALPEMIDALLATVIDDLNDPSDSPLPIFVPAAPTPDYIPPGVYVYAAPTTSRTGFGYAQTSDTVALKEKE